MTERSLDYMLVRDLDPNPENPKAHDVDGLRESMSRLGFIEPAVIDERTQLLVSGHGRVETLSAGEKAGLDAPDGIQADDNGWWMPVVRGWASKDDDEAKAAVVALNAVGEGLWHDEKLGPLLASLETGPGLAGVGLSDERVGELLAATREQASTSRPSPFAEFPEQNTPDVVDFRFGDYAGKIGRPVYDKFVVAVEKHRESSGAVLLDDVLTEWLRLSSEPAVYVDNSADRGA